MGQKLVGLQIDYDCPTKILDRYSLFLHELRKALPKEDLLSITVLLSWFRPGTMVSDVLQDVDEFVPQFYDVDARNISDPAGDIADPIDPVKWAPIFNNYRKPYRIGH